MGTMKTIMTDTQEPDPAQTTTFFLNKFVLEYIQPSQPIILGGILYQRSKDGQDPKYKDVKYKTMYGVSKELPEKSQL